MSLEVAAICMCYVCGRESSEPSPLMALDQSCLFLVLSPGAGSSDPLRLLQCLAARQDAVLWALPLYLSRESVET